MTAMDVATIKGVVDRLMKRGLVRSTSDKADARRRLLALSEEGRAFVEANVATALRHHARNARSARRAREGLIRRSLGQAEVETLVWRRRDALADWAISRRTPSR